MKPAVWSISVCVAGLLVFSGSWLYAQATRQVYYDQEKQLLKERYNVSPTSPLELHGPYESFYITGHRQSGGNYSKGVASGLWKYFYENGGLKMKGFMQEGQPAGLWEYYYESGRMSMKGNLAGKERVDMWTFYFENGQVKSEGAFENSIRQGIWNYFYEDGALKSQAFYENGSGEYKEFYPMGELKAEGFNKDGKSEGEWAYYYESGRQQARGLFKDGEKAGRWIYYHENGEVASEGEYVAGEQEGSWNYYHDDGTLSSQGNLIEGRRDGAWKLFEHGGEFVGDIQYKEDGRGDYKEYYESGKIKVKGTVEGEVREGQWYYYFENGRQEGECYFTHGQGYYKGYYHDGTLKMEGRINDSERVGEWRLYHPDGTLAGLYKPIYEENKPVFRLAEEKGAEDEKLLYEKPEYKFKYRKSRYFTPRPGEYKGWIAAIGPLAPLFGRLPLSVEYYHQERLGYEVQVELLRVPFFTVSSRRGINEPYLSGTGIRFRQKFYEKDTRYGMFYFGHEVGFTVVDCKANVIDSTTLHKKQIILWAREQKVEYGLFLGNRWLPGTGGTGLTLDMYVGAGVGYRFFQKKYERTPEWDAIFANWDGNGISFPLIIGINIGYLGPKKGQGYFVN